MGEAVWHDLECGGYNADLPIWRSLASEVKGTILDVGAGTGRVTLDLAKHGHLVTALDLDAELLTILQIKADRPVPPVIVADAREMGVITNVGFAAIIVPMQTIQMLGPAPERAKFLAGAYRSLRPGGVLACALSNREQIQAWTTPQFELPEPEIARVGDLEYVSQPTAVIHRPDRVILKRVREIRSLLPRPALVSPHGFGPEANTVTLWRCTPKDLELEGREHGLVLHGRTRIMMTDEHGASVVVLLRRP
jgi:SAM-dependent methyltransferase